MDLFATGRKFGLGTAVNYRNLGSETQRSAGGVHSDVAAADNHTFRTGVDGSLVALFISVHKVVAGEELVGRNHSVQVLARNVHESRKTGSRADEHGVVAFLVHQVVHSDRTAHDDVGLELDSKVLEGLDFLADDTVFRKTELGNAVLQHSADLMEHFEDVHLESGLGKVGGAGKARRAAADYGDLLAVGRLALVEPHAVLARPVGHEALELADSYGLTLVAEYTFAFALCFLGAYAAADCGQRAVLCDNFGSLGEIAVLHLLYEIGNLDVDRARTHAHRLLAMQAAARFEHSLFLVIAQTYLVEIVSPYFRVLLPDLDSGKTILHCYSLPILHL